MMSAKERKRAIEAKQRLVLRQRKRHDVEIARIRDAAQQLVDLCNVALGDGWEVGFCEKEEARLKVLSRTPRTTNGTATGRAV